ncbi:MAG: right-handed parallel beta-helix repeat-containing protein [Planctomycetes bacterium]|nr:right-handed parallel beta-helix repeat-containing protein [Planctomycetota bacterium]
MLAGLLPTVATDAGVMTPAYVVPNATFVQQSGETVTTINDTSGSIATVQTAINSARTANASRLIVVNLKANTRYTVTTTPLTLGSNVCLTGSGTTIAAAASASATSLVRISAGSRNVAVSRLALDGGLAALNGLEAPGVSRVNVDQVIVQSAGQDGIFLQGLGSTAYDSEITVTRCEAANSVGAGIHIVDATQAVVLDVSAYGNARGVSLETSADSLIANSRASFNTTAGISLSATTRCKVVGNLCVANAVGIANAGTTTSSTYNFFVNNDFRTGAAGFSMAGQANVLYGNTFAADLTTPLSIASGAGANRIISTGPALTGSGQEIFHPPTAANPHTQAVMATAGRVDVVTAATTLSGVQAAYDAARAANATAVIVLHLTATRITGDATCVLGSRTCVLIDGTIALAAGVTAFSASGDGFISVSGGVIDGGSTTGRPGLSFENCSRVVVEQVTLRNFGAKATRVTNSDVIAFSGCTTPCIVAGTTIDGGAARGIWTKGNSTSSTGGYIFAGNTISNCNMDGIDFDVTTSNSLAYANTSRGNIRYGVFVEEGASLNTVFANTCSSNEIGINVYSSVTGTTIRNSLVANVCDSNQRGIRFGAATGLETSHNFAFNNTLSRSTAKGLDAQSVGTENYCSQQSFSGNVADIGGTTGAVYFNSASFAATATAATTVMTPSVPGTSATPVGSVAITFSKPVTGFGLGDLTLTRGGLPVSLAGATLTSTDSQRYTLGNLSAVTATDGAYVLTFTATGAGVVDAAGQSLTQNATANWTLDTSITVPAGQTIIDSTVRSGSARIVKRGAGTLVLTVAATFTGGTVVEAGTLVVRDAVALGSGSLTVWAGAKVQLDIGSAQMGLASLALDASARLDVGAGGVTVASGGLSLATFRQWLAAGRNGGTWDGLTGIVSSVAAASVAAGATRTVGWIDDGTGSITWAFAAPGDTNLDGMLDVLDAANFLGSSAYDSGISSSWMEGDFNDDGLVDILDAADLIAGGLFDAGSYQPSATDATRRKQRA